ncbi:glycosyltransferase family 2 protein [Persicimonas caeni]|jgi:cellulose synthase/poly-beta-1,6-N-acetylglucosamine synthase-like glycosyltransferase|uniref:Glycosyltransferase family 2 protein n=1 Tax=Persicimonas caeni TaxID=2292766 RepID=A0A4Y6PQ55_PERCE|nr:glycosyltransferase [Persicimonas caeni]QDG50343.1 glycosyltransferase family 2 protein [Persicimonas caeni]QED31564.1 glycosyltransferase family 2 protein [Persicimonas caeni]
MREWVDVFVLCYFIGLNGFYGLLIFFSIFEIARRKAAQLPELDASVLSQTSTPPISILAPAFNEEATIVDSVRAFLQLEYPQHQVIVINDGSTDATLERLKEEFDLEPVDLIVRRQLETEPVRQVYQSKKDARLYVVDKENGGKADALNVGINVSRYPLICCADADTIVTPKALLRMVEPYLYDPQGVVAVGGTVRLANGCKFKQGVLQEVGVPDSWVARFQIVEYLRGFLFGRMGLNRLGGNLIISGAFGLFSREAVVEVGGYESDSVGEDMELVVKLQRHVQQEDPPRQVVHISDPIAYTEAPESLELLSNQRDRWHRGMADAMWRHKSMFLNPKFGPVGTFVFPAYLMFELFGPIIEMFGYFWFVAGVSFGFVDVKFALLFLVVAFWLGALMSIQALVIDNWGFNLFKGVKPRLKLLAAAVLENLGYRQLTLWYRIRGLIKYLVGEKSWGKMTRKGFERHSDDEADDAGDDGDDKAPELEPAMLQADGGE